MSVFCQTSSQHLFNLWLIDFISPKRNQPIHNPDTVKPNFLQTWSIWNNEIVFIAVIKYIVDKQNMGLGSIHANEVWLHVYIYNNPGAHWKESHQPSSPPNLTLVCHVGRHSTLSYLVHLFKSLRMESFLFCISEQAQTEGRVTLSGSGFHSLSFWNLGNVQNPDSKRDLKPCSHLTSLLKLHCLGLKSCWDAW